MPQAACCAQVYVLDGATSEQEEQDDAGDGVAAGDGVVAGDEVVGVTGPPICTRKTVKRAAGCARASRACGLLNVARACVCVVDKRRAAPKQTQATPGAASDARRAGLAAAASTAPVWPLLRPAPRRLDPHTHLALGVGNLAQHGGAAVLGV